MKVFLILMFIVCNLFAAVKSDNCNYSYVTVVYENFEDRDIVCEGIDRIVNYFQSKGLHYSDEIKVKVQDEVIVDLFDFNGKKTSEQRVYGYSNSDSKWIYISSWDTPYVQTRKPFDKLPMNRELHISIVAHEIAHRMLDVRYANLRIPRPCRATHEFFAYTLQILTMNEEEKNRVLSLWPDSFFASELAINSIVWSHAPHRFGVMSYRYAVKYEESIEEILNGNFYSGDEAINLFGLLKFKTSKLKNNIFHQ